MTAVSEIENLTQKYSDGLLTREQWVEDMLKIAFTPPPSAPPVKELHRYGHQNWLSRSIRCQEAVGRAIVNAMVTGANMGEKHLQHADEALNMSIQLEAALRCMLAEFKRSRGKAD